MPWIRHTNTCTNKYGNNLINSKYYDYHNIHSSKYFGASSIKCPKFLDCFPLFHINMFLDVGCIGGKRVNKFSHELDLFVPVVIEYICKNLL